MDLNSIKSQLDKTESQLAQYGANLPSEIQTQVQSAYTPLLERSLGVTKDLMSDYLGRAMETTSMGPGMQGTTAYDLSPTQRMGVIGRELGTMGGQLNSAISYSDYLGGQMNDLYGKAVQAAQLGQQNLADQYARQFQQYQLAWQEAEAAKDRAASLRAAQIAASAYSQPTPTPAPTPGPDQTVPQELAIEVADPINVKQVLSGTGGGVVTKKSGTKPLIGGILPNSGGQVFNLGSQYGIPSSDLLFNKLFKF
jgi:hypothetical protein